MFQNGECRDRKIAARIFEAVKKAIQQKVWSLPSFSQ